MSLRSEVEGYDEFCKLINELESKTGKLYVFFSGSKDSNGKSWCPDCVTALPVVEKVVKELDNIHFVYVNVGDRTSWKDPNSPFRKDKRMKLKSVPTFMIWGQPEKLEEDECANEDLVKMLLEQS